MVDKNKIQEAVRLLLEGIGEDVTREGLVETPDRIARMYEEIFAGLQGNPAEALNKTFHTQLEQTETPSGNTDMIIEKDITFHSMCEHHLLPFFGKVHIAYIPDQEVAGLSKLARTVEVFARRPQLQERMTVQIADALMEHLHAKGAMVIIEAEHMCMSMRGIKKPGANTITLASKGEFANNPQLQQTFINMAGIYR